MKGRFAIVRIAILTAFLLPTRSTAWCQQELQVVEKRIERDLTFKAGQEIRVTAEKAEVIVNGWGKDYIQCSIRLIAKNRDRKVALEELGYLKYTIGSSDEIIEIGNAFSIPEEVRSLKSSLHVIFEISIPATASLSVGTRFSNVDIRDIGGKLTCQSKNGTLKLNNAGGHSSINCSFADVLISPGPVASKGISIQATRSEISLLISEIQEYEYTLHSIGGPILVKQGILNSEVKSDGSNHFLEFNRKTSNPLIKIYSNNGTIQFK